MFQIKKIKKTVVELIKGAASSLIIDSSMTAPIATYLFSSPVAGGVATVLLCILYHVAINNPDETKYEPDKIEEKFNEIKSALHDQHNVLTNINHRSELYGTLHKTKIVSYLLDQSLSINELFKKIYAMPNKEYEIIKHMTSQSAKLDEIYSSVKEIPKEHKQLFNTIQSLSQKIDPIVENQILLQSINVDQVENEQERRKRDIKKLNCVFSNALKIKAWDRFFDDIPYGFICTEILGLWEIFLAQFDSGFWHLYDEFLTQEFNSFANNLHLVFNNCANLFMPANGNLVLKKPLSTNEQKMFHYSISLSVKANQSYKEILAHIRKNYLEVNIDVLSTSK